MNRLSNVPSTHLGPVTNPIACFIWKTPCGLLNRAEPIHMASSTIHTENPMVIGYLDSSGSNLYIHLSDIFYKQHEAQQTVCIFHGTYSIIKAEIMVAWAPFY